MVKPELIAIDLDGTLLVDHRHISDENIAAIRLAESLGIQVYLVSGRAVAGMLPAAKALDLTTPLISLNGSFIYQPDMEEIVFSHPIPRELANQVLEIFKRRSIYIGYHANLNWYVDKDCREMRAEGKSMDRKPIFVESLLEAEIPAPNKLVAIEFSNEDFLQEAYQELRQKLPHLNAHFSETFALEMFDNQVSKATALQYILELHHLSAEQLMVIGDNYNDISMMQFAGYSVAMGNAPSDVKLQADWIAPSNIENGVAAAIQRIHK